MEAFVVRNARDVDEVRNAHVKFANMEEWNPGKQDAESFYLTDPKGFFVGELNAKIIASISAVAYDDKYGFLGYYVCLPEFRGKGLQRSEIFGTN
jgi:hypothetical protein